MKTAAELAHHNHRQREYFETTLKRTMLPHDSPYVRRQIDQMITVAQLRPGDRVLEVGCGMGRYTLPLAARGIAVEGFDLSPVLLDRLRSFDGGRFGIPLYAGDIAEPSSLPRASYDAVIGFFTLHHLHDLEPCLRGMAALLKPRGCLAFLEPNPYNPLYYLQILATPRMTWAAERGLARMRSGVVFQTMRRIGLEPMALRRFGFFPPMLANRRGAGHVERALESIPVWQSLLPFQIFGARKP